MSIGPRKAACLHCGHDPRAEVLSVSDALRRLRALSDAVAAIGQHGFDKDTTKDREAFLRWRMLNDAQAAARKLLDGDSSHDIVERS